MAGLNPNLQAQLRAVGSLRCHLFVNSLRSIRGRLNLVSRSIAGLFVLGAGLGGGVLLAIVAWGMTSEHQLAWLPVPFWIISIFWQLFPVMATAFTQNIDATILLRFPLSYAGYFLVRLIYGVLDIATALGLCWSLGLLVGISAADLALAPWALVAVGGLVLFNIALARMTFVWIEHWLSSRRSREVMGVLCLMLLISFQVAGPILGRFSKRPAHQKFALLAKLLPLERALPPGLAAAVISEAAQSRISSALLSGALLGAYTLAALGILHLRLRGQYSGKNLYRGEKPRSAVATSASLRHGWRVPWLSGPVSAVYEKEMRYFSRSGPMLFTLLMPIIMVFVLWGGRRALMGQQMNFVFPIGAAYCLLVLTNVVYNSFGADGGGIQFFLVSPISFRQITAAKNLAQSTVLLLDVAILWLGVRLVFQPPRLRLLLLTGTWLLFATPINFAFGNLLSLYSPKRIDYAVFGRQRAAETTILVSLAVQLTVMGVGALALYTAHRYHSIWVAITMLSILAIPSMAGYFLLLGRIPRIAFNRREVLTSELCKT
jgi:ABC-2 type transport system permease protein